MVNFTSTLQSYDSVSSYKIKENFFIKLFQLNFSVPNLLVSADKIIGNVSMNKSKSCVTVDGDICQNKYVLFYKQTNQKTVSCSRKT